ncbi:MAG TPA: carboxypeptidase-like regulatory domain-containing protein [Pyrinomonadaceae bacterium]|nr:carboxypeptidase-like regulatory domain-containing protein [Pyrinomonadaceae bacterium]
MRPINSLSYRRFAAAVLFIALAIITAQAQTTSMTVTVKDSKGAAMAGVTVRIKNEVTNQTFETQANDEGIATFSGLPPGKYTVEVEATGFKKSKTENVEVTVSRATSVPITMDVVPVVVVTGPDTELLEARQELSSIPNLNNDLTPLLQIVPGAVAAGPASLGRVIVDGKGVDQQTLRLDGVDFAALVDFPSADSAINPVTGFQKPEVAGNLDSPKTRSGAHGFEPRYGPGTGFVSEVSTYRGSEPGWQFQIYGDLRNDAFNARNFFDYDGENGLRRGRFGGKFARSLDKKERMFAFFAYDGIRGRTERNLYEAIPIAAVEDNPSGPLATAMRGFRPPGTLVLSDKSLNPSFMVASRRGRTTVNSNAFDARFDYFPHLFSDVVESSDCPYLDEPQQCDAITLRVTHQIAENRVPEGITGRSQLQQFVFSNAVASWKINKAAKGVRHEIEKKRSVKEFGHQFKIGFNQMRAEMRTERPSSGDGLDQSLITTDGLVDTQGLNLTPALEGQLSTVPVATLGGLSAAGRGLYLKPRSYSAIYDYSRLLTRSAMHELYAGVEARFIRFDYDRLGGLSYKFPNVGALRTGTPATVTFLSDLSGASPFVQGTGPRRARQNFYMGYVQMVSQFLLPENEPNLEPKVTVFYGVRYDHFGRVNERDNRTVVVDPLTGEITAGGTRFYRVDHANIQPRAGITYRLSNTGVFKNTVLRAGVGLYSGVPRISDLTLPIDSNRFSTGINGSFPVQPADVIRGFIESPLTRRFQPIAFAKDFSPLERSLKWDVKLTHSHNGYDFSAYYIGNIGRNLALANFANRIISVTTNPDPAKDAIVIREFDVIEGNQVSQPFGEFLYRRGGGSSSFNALTLQLARDTDDKRLEKWFTKPVVNFNVKYTLSRSVGNVSGTIMSNPLDPDADFGHNSGVPTHSFSWTTGYNLWEISKGKLYDPLLGWKLTSNLRATSGLPLAVRLQRPDVVYVDAAGNVFKSPAAGLTARLNTPSGGSSTSAFVPNLVPNKNPYMGGFADRRFLNPEAFSVPAPGELGNLRRGRLRGPMFVQLDLGLRRNLTFVKSETLVTEFQVDVFNVFNHTNFSNPGTTLSPTLGVAQNELQPGLPFTHATAGSFGILTAAEAGRIIQFSVTLKFNGGFTK